MFVKVTYCVLPFLFVALGLLLIDAGLCVMPVLWRSILEVFCLLMVVALNISTSVEVYELRVKSGEEI